MALAALQRDYPAVEATKPNTLGSPRYGSQNPYLWASGRFSVENAVKNTKVLPINRGAKPIGF